MKSLRSLLSAVLGLALLVQGAAAVAAPHAMAAKASSTAQMSSEMPCHHSKALDPAPAQPCHGCDQNCPDMSGCAFGHITAVVPAVGLDFVAARQTIATVPDPSAESITLPSHLRPPIVSRL